ncbi:MAG: urea ABC transporter permease subunit UrtB [Helicobacteraceae bacterium]|jgi:urea transport system permease protein|nr:urea ABC transporter permease subunit UrtB [Helicobacteraceae bacterium]
MKLFCWVFFYSFFIAFSFGASLEEDLSALKEASSFAQKEEAIAALSENYAQDDRFLRILEQMLAGNLYKIDDKLFFLSDSNYLEVIGGDPLTIDENNPPQKITINNRLRNVLRSALIAANLFASDPKTRLHAAKEALNNVEEKDLSLLKNAYEKESDETIREILAQSLAVLGARRYGAEDRLKTIVELGGYMSPKALTTLKELSAIEDEPYKEAIARSIEKIESKQSFYRALETLYFGLSAGSILLLAAIGLAITFGVMKVINMAHGELIMIGAYTTYALQQWAPNLIEYSVLIAIPSAFLVSAFVGVLIERLVLRRLYARPLEALLATFGISLILQQLARTCFSAQNRDVQTPAWMSGSFEINGFLSLTYNRFYILIFAVLVFALVMFLLNKTSIGLKVRAVTQNRSMAQAMGINTGFIDALTFGIGSGVAGMAGVALSQLTNVGPNLGQAYIVDSFMVVVFGGVGNLWGAALGALTLGELNKILEPFAGAMLAKILILVFVILFIQKRPRGLFPQKGRDAEE